MVTLLSLKEEASFINMKKPLANQTLPIIGGFQYFHYPIILVLLVEATVFPL